MYCVLGHPQAVKTAWHELTDPQNLPDLERHARRADMMDAPAKQVFRRALRCARERAAGGKRKWNGRIISVVPRIRLTRSFDQRDHTYLGYILCISGRIAAEDREFTIAVGKALHAKHSFQAGMDLSGVSVPVADPRMELAEFYKTSGIKILEHPSKHAPTGQPPFLGVPPELPVYQKRGHRRLSSRTYNSRCTACIWGCRMPVEMIVDHWNPSVKRYRFETFCYGPKSCKLYKAGPPRKVPGRKGMSWTEEDWVDEEETGHRGLERE